MPTTAAMDSQADSEPFVQIQLIHPIPSVYEVNTMQSSRFDQIDIVWCIGMCDACTFHPITSTTNKVEDILSPMAFTFCIRAPDQGLFATMFVDCLAW